MLTWETETFIVRVIKIERMKIFRIIGLIFRFLTLVVLKRPDRPYMIAGSLIVITLAAIGKKPPPGVAGIEVG